MVNGINFKFNLPVAYHFTNSMQAHEKGALILIVLRALSEIGLIVIALTFDGLVTNTSTCNILGACLDADNGFRPHITDPIDGHKIYIFFDAPHMMKLIRNCFGTYKTLYNNNDSKIEWRFIEQLVELREECDIVTNKLTKKHILFGQNIMNVSLAAQTLSESVAKSIEKFAIYPKTKSMFEGSFDTAGFTRRMNNLFDVFNSNADYKGAIFKSPINSVTKETIFSFLDVTSEYIRGLKQIPAGKSIIYSKRRTGFLGFLVNIHNIKEMYTEFVESGKMDCIRTETLNQDPLESFFGRIRTCCLGSNDNPTDEQFLSGYRKTLVSTELTSSVFSNCVDKLSILHVPSSNKPKTFARPIIVMVDRDETSDKRSISSNESSIQDVSKLLSSKMVPEENNTFSFDGSELTVCYIANVIEMKVKTQTRTNCPSCIQIVSNLFEENVESSIMHSPNKNDRIPCDSTVKICEISNTFLRREAFRITFNYSHLVLSIENELEMDSLYGESDFSHNLNHKNELVRYIIGEFVRERATHIAREITLNEQKKIIRRNNLKSIHFAGQ